MSLRPLVSSSEPRVHRDEESALMKASSQKSLAPGQLDGSIASLDSRQTTPAHTPSPAASRRRVIIPDPVAFRYVMAAIYWMVVALLMSPYIDT